MINKTLNSLGFPGANWYSNASYWPAILVVIRVWKNTGMSVVIYLAAITGFDMELYEAARIDGAGRLKQISSITLPLLFPTICILTLMSIGRIFYGDFGMIYALIRDNGTLQSTTDVIETYVFRALRKTGSPSQAMAVSLYQSVLGFVLVFGSNWLIKRFFNEGALF